MSRMFNTRSGYPRPTQKGLAPWQIKDFELLPHLDKIIEKLAHPQNKYIQLQQYELESICHKAREAMLAEPSLLELRAPLNILGDIHGQYQHLLEYFIEAGYPPSVNFLFLGDYVDRGKQSIETLTLLLAYKIKYPEHMHLLRGNHESAALNRNYGFFDECKRRYNIKMWRTFVDCYNCMPLAAIVEKTIFCCHGGLSPMLRDMDQIRAIKRPCDIPDEGLVCDLLWSDPERDIIGWDQNERGVSYTFGENVVENFLKRHDFSLICRAHQVVEDGYEFFANRQLITLFSAPNYCGEFDNAGAMLIVDPQLLCKFHIQKPS